MSEQPRPPEKRYDTLRTVAEALGGLAILLLVFGVGAVLYGISQLDERGGTTGILIAVAGGAGVVLSLSMSAGGEAIRVMLDTEMNTRQAATAAATMLADLREIRDAFGRIDASTRRTAQAVEALAAMVRK